MNRISPILTVCFLVTLLNSCNNSNTVPLQNQYLDNELTTSIKIDINEDRLNLDSIVRGYKLTCLETLDICLIGEVSKIIYRNNKYYILDRHQQKSLFVFDDNGKFCHAIGKTGRGPGEFTEPTDFAVLDSTVMVFDMLGRQLLYYNTEGSFIKSAPLNYIIHEVESNRDGSIFYAVSGENPKCDSIKNFELFEIGSDGRILSPAFENKYTMNFSDKYDLQCFNDNIIYKKALRAAVYQLQKDKIIAKYTFNISSQALPENYEVICKGDFEKFIDNFRDDYTYFNGQFWETDRYVGVGITSKRLPYFVLYDKDTQETMSGLVGITFGKKEIDLSGLFMTAFSGPVDVDGNQVIGVIDGVRLSPEWREALLGEGPETGFANPVILSVDLNHPQI